MPQIPTQIVGRQRASLKMRLRQRDFPGKSSKKSPLDMPFFEKCGEIESEFHLAQKVENI